MRIVLRKKQLLYLDEVAAALLAPKQDLQWPLAFLGWHRRLAKPEPLKTARVVLIMPGLAATSPYPDGKILVGPLAHHLSRVRPLSASVD